MGLLRYEYKLSKRSATAQKWYPYGSKDMIYVNEAGLYALILGSRKAQAREFNAAG